LGTQVFAQDALNRDVTVSLEKRIKMPDVEKKSTLTTLTRLAWSEVTNQIVVAPFASGQQYIVNPDSGRAIEYNPRLNGIEDPKLMWSRKKPLLIGSRMTQTQILDTSRSPDEPPTLVRKIDNVLPHPLLVRGAALVEVDGDEWVVIAGETNRQLDPSNPELVAHSISTGERTLAWQLPGDGASNYFYGVAAVANKGRVSVATWVNHYKEPTMQPSGLLMSELLPQMWIIRPQTKEAPCVIEPLRGAPRLPTFSTGPLALSPDGTWLAFGEGQNDKVVHLHRAHDCAFERDLPLGDGPRPSYLTFSPDGRWLLGTSPMHQGKEEGRIQLWRTSDWKLVYDGVMLLPYQAAFNKEGSRFAVATVGGIYVYRINQR